MMAMRLLAADGFLACSISRAGQDGWACLLRTRGRVNEMRLSYVAAWSLLWCVCFWYLPGAYGQNTRGSRTFDFTYHVTLKDIPPKARQVHIWIPVASTNLHQNVRILKISSPVSHRVTREAIFGNRMLYLTMQPPYPVESEFKVVYRITRKAYSEGNYSSLQRYNQDPPLDLDAMARYLEPNRLVPTGGSIARIAHATTQGKQGEIDKAFALYNYVFQNMRYDKSGTGWGRGDALWACDAKHGNCTDFHSLFIALARAEKIPADFDIGFPLPTNVREGNVPGYHCWAKFYVEGLGWVPVDISEAWQNPSKRDFYFGSVDADRVEFSTGRDLLLAPRQKGPPVNYFIYPYVEVDGKPFKGSIEQRFSFRDVEAQ